jgi:hypothetical protein
MLDKLCKHDKKFREMAFKMCHNKQLADDIVQDMYIKIHKYSNESSVFNKNEVNLFYIYKVLWSILNTYYNEQSKFNELKHDIHFEDEPDVEEQAWCALMNKIESEIDTWYWYDAGVFRMYRDSKLSFRKLSTKTDISWVSLFNTVKDGKNKIRDKFNEDYEDYKNGDYDLI